MSYLALYRNEKKTSDLVQERTVFLTVMKMINQDLEFNYINFQFNLLKLVLDTRKNTSGFSTAFPFSCPVRAPVLHTLSAPH